MGNKKLQQTQAQVNEVVDIMRQNVETVIDRDVKLSELDQRAGALQAGATQFESQASQLKRKYWWKNMRMWLIIGVIGFMFLLFVIFKFKGSSDESESEAGTVNSAEPIADTSNIDGGARRRRWAFEHEAAVNF